MQQLRVSDEAYPSPLWPCLLLGDRRPILLSPSGPTGLIRGENGGGEDAGPCPELLTGGCSAPDRTMAASSGEEAADPEAVARDREGAGRVAR